jgi:AcrR family transcriptional regulator
VSGRNSEKIRRVATPGSQAKRVAKPRKAPAASDLAPQQERSRESLRRMRRAAAEVLGQHGLEGTTIPRIAAHAGLTPGAIYRRFSDKDALLESVIMDIYESQEEHLRNGLTREMAMQIPLSVFADQLVHSLLVSFRAHASLLRAMRQFVLNRQGTDYWKKVSRLEKRFHGRLVDLLLTNAGEIKHPEPRAAISLGLTMVISTLQEVVVNIPDPTYWKESLPKNDQALRRELTRAFLAYLGISHPV